MSRLIRSLHKLTQPPEADRLRDDQLLERFVADRDQGAFELLLWRHGPMVLGVCRRVLPTAHDAEDAFQATWLTFVKKAGSIVHRAAVGSWLYQVAHRVALRARQTRAKRSEREIVDVHTLAVAPAEDIVEPGELGRVLDEEVNRLPARQRVAFVLCCLEGRTGEEAARELGCPPGTVSSRLTRARERLRQRLIRRGIAPAVAAATGAAAGDAWSYPVSAMLADTTLKAALLFSSGKAAGGALTPQAVLLAEGVLRAMFVTKLKIAAALVLTAAVLATGGIWTHRTLTAAPQEKEKPAPAAEPPAQPPKPAPKAEAVPAARKVPKELLEKRLEVVQTVYKQNQARTRSGQGLPVELLSWSERWLDAELALRDKKADRIAAFKAHVERTRELEQMLTAFAKTGQGKVSDAAAATYERINAEIRYFQATGEQLPKAEERAPRK
ncbi:MAG TPA: RNA polymerase sigma factor [Gemmataceae bacterium]